MSFEIYISCFRDGEPSTFPRALAEKIFGSYTTSKKDDPSWVLTFPDGDKSELNLGPEPQIDGFMVNRPTGSPELWNGIIEILKRTSSVLYWPGEATACVVADAAVIPHLPPDMVESIGTPVVTTDSEKIQDVIRSSA